MLLFLNNNYCWCTSTAPRRFGCRVTSLFFTFLRLAYVERVAAHACPLLLLLFCVSLLCAGCVHWRLYPRYYQSFCLLFEFTLVNGNENAAAMQSVQYIYRFFLDICIWRERCACFFLSFCSFLLCVFKVVRLPL